MARLGLFYDELEVAEIYDGLQRQTLRRQMRQNHLLQPMAFFSDKEFYDTYRMSKSLANEVIHEVEPYMPAEVRSTSISTVSRILTTLEFYATGSYQRVVGQCTQHMSQPSVSKSVQLVTKALNAPEILQKYIKFPQTQQERNNVKRGFYDKFRLPGVIGCIDGTHVSIIRPTRFEERFFNRKHYHSINTQIICDSDSNIISVDASFGGASHDSFIWEQHPLRQHMEQLQTTESAWFLGDSGYSQRSWMMTPILDAFPNTPEAYFTERQMSARSTVERTIGVLKARWRCLLVHRVLHYDPATAGEITNACVVLHNILNSTRIPVSPLNEAEERQEREYQIFRAYNDRDAGIREERTRNRLLAQGRRVRNNLVNRIWQDRRI